MTADTPQLVEALAARLKEQALTLAVAESCTGGLLAAKLTDLAGSSVWFERGFVSYANLAKEEMLGVPAATLTQHGAVSEATAQAMAAGAIQHSHADCSISITGIAGPSGGSPDKPVGTVCFAWCQRGQAPSSLTRHFAGDRQAVREQAVIQALQGLLERL